MQDVSKKMRGLANRMPLESLSRKKSNYSFFCMLFCLSMLVALTTAAELPTLPEFSSGLTQQLAVTLTLEQTTVSIGSFTFKTRLYNGQLPGPILRIKRGDTVRVHMVNNLDQTSCGFPAGTAVVKGEHNAVRDPCITNLHTHGLHVSSATPEDNVFVEIGPGGKFYDYEYKIPANHLGGTHWYHPHHHGSTSGHVGGGASGMIIVEDDVSDALPAAYRNLEEHAIMLTAIDTNVAEVEAAGGGTWVTAAPASPVLLANGLVSPTLTVATMMMQKKWIRIRFAFSATQRSLAITVPAACKAILLAKDGVYLPRGARSTTVLKFAPGNRVDIAISCSAGTHAFTSSPDDAAAGDEHMGSMHDDELGVPMKAFPAGTVFYVKCTGMGADAPDLPALTYTVPTYLRDLTAVTADERFSQGVTVGMAENGCTFECGAYQKGTILQYMSVNKVQEFDVNANAHPLHMHINHMQLTTVRGGGWDGWHQEGDFVDTFLGSGTVRFLTDSFTGEVIMHCHLLIHEDFGCMTQMMIVDDKTKQPWGYCLHGEAIPSIAAISLSTVSAFLACLLAYAYSGRLQTLFPTDKWSCGRDDVICGVGLQSFGAKASFFMVPLFVASVLPLVNDDGHSGGLVAVLHANEASYMAFLPLHIVFMLVVLGAALWLAWARWLRGIMNEKIQDGDIAMMSKVPDADANDNDAQLEGKGECEETLLAAQP